MEHMGCIDLQNQPKIFLNRLKNDGGTFSTYQPLYACCPIEFYTKPCVAINSLVSRIASFGGVCLPGIRENDAN